MQIEPDDNQADVATAARRDALRKIALFGAYTAPVMLGMLASTKAASASTYSTQTPTPTPTPTPTGGGGACFGGHCTIFEQ